jgi:hypothetical protein
MSSLPANSTTRSSDLSLEIPVPISCAAPDLQPPICMISRQYCFPSPPPLSSKEEMDAMSGIPHCP